MFVKLRLNHSGKLETNELVELLIIALKDTVDTVQQAAAISLQQIGGEHVIELLIELLKDDSAHVREVAATSLGQIGGERAIQPFDD